LTAYSPSEWTDLFVASAGASAALAGLVFVAVSINIDRILKFPGLPARALETLMLLLSVLVVSTLALIPDQSHTALGIELLVEGVVITVVVTTLAFRSLPSRASRQWLVGRLVVAALGTVPLVVGGATLLAATGGGLYWTVGGILGATAGAVLNAWVLLVEILR
jgi:modulator of FtsH protease